MQTNFEIRNLFLDFFSELEELGLYLRDGLLDIRYISLLAGDTIVVLYEKYKPVTEISSVYYGTEAEYLYKKIKEYKQQNT